MFKLQLAKVCLQGMLFFPAETGREPVAGTGSKLYPRITLYQRLATCGPQTSSGPRPSAWWTGEFKIRIWKGEIIFDSISFQ